MKKKIYTDTFEFDQQKRYMGKYLFKANECAQFLEHNGYSVTYDTICDCVYSKAVSVPVEEGSMNLRTEYENNGHIFADTQRMIEEVRKASVTPAEAKARETAIVEAYEDMMNEIVSVMARNEVSGWDARRMFATLISVRDGKVFFVDNYLKELEESCTIYCKSKEAEKLMELHTKAVDILNEIASTIKPGTMCDDFNALFGWDGKKVVKAEINYNLFV